MQILLLQDQSELREKIVFLVESTYGAATVCEASTVKEALDLIQKRGVFNLIVVDSKESLQPPIKKLWESISDIPVVICLGGANTVLPQKVMGAYDRAEFVQGVTVALDAVARKLGLQKKDSGSDQVRIKTKLLLSVCPLEGDIYIRLSDTKFVKLFQQGDVFDLNDLEKYTVKKGVEYLYIRREQCKEFAQKYRQELQKLLNKKDLKIEDVGNLASSVHETIHELNTQIGFTEEVQALTKTQVNLTVKAMGKDPSLMEVLKRIQESNGKYISSHSTLCAYLACAIAAKMQWGSETTFYKLSLASFLHDISLSNHELAEINTLEELDKSGSKFTDKEKLEFKSHPVYTSEMAKGMSEVPPDVDVIIRQHHERPDGKGFPRGLGHAYIAPLAGVFIVAHDLSQYALKAGSKFSLSTYILGGREKYKSSQFKKILTALEEAQKGGTSSRSTR